MSCALHFRWLLRHFNPWGSDTTVHAACMGSGTDVIAALLEGLNVTAVDYSKVMFNGALARVEEFIVNEANRLQLASRIVPHPKERLLAEGDAAPGVEDHVALLYHILVPVWADMSLVLKPIQRAILKLHIL